MTKQKAKRPMLNKRDTKAVKEYLRNRTKKAWLKKK